MFSFNQNFRPFRSSGRSVRNIRKDYHTREDEYSYVLDGRVGAVFDGEEAYANAGELVWVDVDFDGTEPIMKRRGLSM